MLRRLFRWFIGASLLLFVLGVAAFGLSASYSASGWIELFSIGVFALGLFLPSPRARGLSTLVAVALFAGVIISRVAVTGSGKTTVITLPKGKSSRWLSRLVDEQDVSLWGARVLKVMWGLKGRERTGLVSTMHDTYVEMRDKEGVTASPVLDTLLFRQDSDAFDTIVVEPAATPKAAVIFLHGFAGSFTLECWMVAEAARAIDALTVCPATGFDGWWANQDGELTVRETIDYLHSRGIQRIFLAGLSNGGVGASWLAPKLVSDLKGVIIISGAPSSGGTAGLPTLVIQGDQDPNMPATNARAFASRVHGTYAELEGGHFVLMMQKTAAQAAIANWLRQQQ